MALSFLPVDGAVLAYQCQGAGPYLLAIPGANGDAVIFDQVAPYLAESFTVCTYDRRGYTNSTLTAAADESMPHRLQRDADDAAALIANITDGAPALVLGTSSGAIVALDLLQRHSDAVDFLIAHEPPLSYVLGDTVGGAVYAAFASVYDTYLAEGTEAAALAFLGSGAATSTDVETQAAYQALTDPAREDNAERFFTQEIATYTAVNESIPTLVGLNDKFVMDIGEACAIPFCNISTVLAAEVGVKLYETPGGHLGYISEPEGFAAKVRSIFSEQGKI